VERRLSYVEDNSMDYEVSGVNVRQPILGPFVYHPNDPNRSVHLVHELGRFTRYVLLADVPAT
jgi:hypothetical protein